MTSRFRSTMRVLALALVAFATSEVAVGAPYQCPFCSLAGKNLSGQDLTDANLQGADLSGANLSGATLNGAELAGANLTNANLSNAVLNPSASGQADLSRANLAAANLAGASMTGADLQYAEMPGTNFARANLTGAYFGPAPRTGIYAGRKTSFRSAKLPAGLKLDGATSDATGAQKMLAEAAAVNANAFQVNCGSSDLSQLASAVYVTPDGTDSDSCGTTLDTACATIWTGIDQCQATGCGVLVGYGKYALTSPINPRAFDSHVYGGCVPKSEGSSGGLKSWIQAPPGGAPAVNMGNLASARFENFKIQGSPAAGGSGAASIAFQMHGENLTLVDSEIYAASGTDGAEGCSNCMNFPIFFDSKLCFNGKPSPDTQGTFSGEDGSWSPSRGGDGGAIYSESLLISGGGGGQQGGGSFAVEADWDSVIQIHSSRIVGGRGGNGGRGGPGQLLGYPLAGSGNGGPAIGIAELGNAQVSYGSNDLKVYPGKGGKGATGVYIGQVCQFNTAGSGGTVADVQSFQN